MQNIDQIKNRKTDYKGSAANFSENNLLNKRSYFMVATWLICYFFCEIKKIFCLNSRFTARKMISGYRNEINQKINRICSLPWRKLRPIWPWSRQRPERGGRCWNINFNFFLINFYIKIFINFLHEIYSFMYLLSVHDDFWGLDADFWHIEI